MSGTAMIPWLLRRKSPKARDMARPGVSSWGSHTRCMCGSPFSARTRPLHFLIRSASPKDTIKIEIKRKINRVPHIKVGGDGRGIKVAENRNLGLLGTLGFRSVVNWTALSSPSSFTLPSTALESPRFAMISSSPCYHQSSPISPKDR